MPLFKNIEGKLKLVKEQKIPLEKDLQKLTEENLENIFGLKFISSEFTIQNFRIDTLAFDGENKSFVIIEYKRDRSFSVIDQGYSYLALMLNNKADFILEYNEKMKDNLKRDAVDWSQSRVLFLSTNFTTYQQNAINFKDLPIELWEVNKYDNDTLLYSELKTADSKESIKTVSKNKTIENVSKEVKKYSVDEHFKDGWEKSREIFDELRTRLLDLDGRIGEKPTKSYIGYQIEGKNMTIIRTRKSSLNIELPRTQPKDVKDPEGRVKYINNCIKYYGQHISWFAIDSMEDIDYAMSLIRQTYKKHFE
ncbi:hypothetical protein KJ951_01115 [Patescibacteria group bacterium]|nr:hypothetical protein [Patescibacteria group bacterium]MBU1702980.1 hypothetical protein [Patescibacteria group bacterium]